MAYNTKPRKDKYINLWMSKESEEMLIKHRISSSCRIVKGCIKVTISKKHCNSPGKNRE